MMSLIRSLVVIFALPISFSAMAANGIELTCNIGTPALESAAYKRAPHGAKRIGKHKIEVKWKSGKHVFKDEPPYDEPLAGVKWGYCGYNTELKVHLLEKSDGSLFTGVMLDDETGEILSAGSPVRFSPDRKHYLAYEQEDGRDGVTINLYQKNGILEWTGYAGILTADESTIIAYFEKIDWNDKGGLQASAVCMSGKAAGTLTLVPKANGQWQWSPKVRC